MSNDEEDPDSGSHNSETDGLHLFRDDNDEYEEID